MRYAPSSPGDGMNERKMFKWRCVSQKAGPDRRYPTRGVLNCLSSSWVDSPSSGSSEFDELSRILWAQMLFPSLYCSVYNECTATRFLKFPSVCVVLLLYLTMDWMHVDMGVLAEHSVEIAHCTRAGDRASLELGRNSNE